MEQVTRIGLVTKPWQGLVLPLNYTCKSNKHFNNISKINKFVNTKIHKTIEENKN